jgi:hypothetical protein
MIHLQDTLFLTNTGNESSLSMTTTTAPPCIGYQGGMWQVHKFGGTSVANANCFGQVTQIIWSFIPNILLRMMQIHQQTVNWALLFRPWEGLPKRPLCY